MEIFVFAILTILTFGLAALNKYYTLLGIVAGIGLIMLALMVQVSGLQMQVGTLESVRTDLNMTNITAIYQNVNTVLGGQDWIITIVAIVFGAAGILILLGAIFNISIK